MFIMRIQPASISATAKVRPISGVLTS